MSRPLKRIRLPRIAQSWSKKLNLPRLVNDKSWVSEARFKVIDNVRQTWTALGQSEMADDPEAIVSAAFSFFAKDGDLERWVLDECEQDMTEADSWENATIAYCWVVLQRYNKELGGEDD